MRNKINDLIKDMQQVVHDESRQGEIFYKTGLKFNKFFYIESYGCAMNFSDSEIVASILQKEGYGPTKNVEEANLIFLNSCSIREKAELTLRKRLTDFKKTKLKNPSLMIGVLGCMAERLKEKFLVEEKLVDMVVGPDAYRSIPMLIKEVNTGQKAVNVLLSRDETYSNIAPIRLDTNGISAYISIMRGCNNMCSFCVVPFTRGRERSRDLYSILDEAKELINNGYKEVVLLGQNVDSYNWYDESLKKEFNFANMLEQIAMLSATLRVRFSTSHPKDITADVLDVMVKYKNICKYIHLPIQSGNNRILQLMNRNYSPEWYKQKIELIRKKMPECAISSDIIAGFCSETEEEHQDTLKMMEYCNYDMSYMFYYSERPGTLAARRYKDDILLETKKRRLQEIIDLQNTMALKNNASTIGKIYEVLVEGNSKRDSNYLMGRNSQNKIVVFPKVFENKV
ncbi:MAG: tRNA (N6-isopentenyl adenosine(37)-C2)-methylthiotransferase MiaB, partial [Sediminibacterium sp.]|nr:tRNA (N6-isopentenyl adenosine(37)-C2)-methylthiotransferase MiaB [Sediminibacterium sp.]